MRDFRSLLGARQRPSNRGGMSLAAIAIAALIASACGAENQARPPQSTDTVKPTPTRWPVPSIAGVSPACAEAVLYYARGASVAVEYILTACTSEAELSRAAHALDQSDISDDVGRFVAHFCAELEYPTGSLCPPAVPPTATPMPTPYVATIWEDDTFADHARELCEASRPRGLTSVTSEVEAVGEPPEVAGIYLQIVSYTDLGGRVRPEPSLQRGYVYAIQYDGDPVFEPTYPDEVDVIACAVLVATEAEQWYPQYQGGCPCDTYHAAEAFLWAIDAQGERIGAPWRRLPADMDNDERSEELITGFKGDPGLRPPNQSDIIADLEALLGLDADP